jgi:hypothetical protein
MFVALPRLGRTSELVTYDGEGHHPGSSGLGSAVDPRGPCSTGSTSTSPSAIVGCRSTLTLFSREFDPSRELQRMSNLESAQDHHGICARGAAGGNVAGQEDHRGQNQRDDNERGDVECGDRYDPVRREVNRDKREHEAAG